MQKGLAEGIHKGEYEKAVEVAKRMIAKNENIDKIIEYTGLTKTEIEKLKTF